MQPTEPNSPNGSTPQPGIDGQPVVRPKFVLPATEDARIHAELDADALAGRGAEVDEAVAAEVLRFEQRAHVRDDLQVSPDWQMPDPLDFRDPDDGA